MIRNILLATFAVASQICAQPTTVTLTGPVYDAFGQLYGGSVLVQGQVKTLSGYAISGTTRTVFITSGALSLALVPNAGAVPPSTSYLVTFSNGDKWTCVVPSSGPVAFTSACNPNAPPPLPTYQGPAGPTGPPGIADGGYAVLSPVSTSITPDLSFGLTLSVNLTSTQYTVVDPIWTGSSISPGVSFTLITIQDSTGGRPIPTFTTGTNGFASSANNQSPVTTANTETIYNFTNTGTTWTLTNFKTGLTQ